MNSKDSLQQGFIEKEVELNGFDGLWDVDYHDAQSFIKLKKAKLQNKQKDEIALLQRELDEKDFAVQKLEWQLGEREKELKNLYGELHRMLELNKKLDFQLQDFEDLVRKQEKTMEKLGIDPQTKTEPDLPKF